MQYVFSVVVVLLAVLWSVSAGPVVAAQTVEDFEFSSFEADYYLSRGDGGHSRMRVEERLVAEFPEYDQNKGIVREIPVRYQGRPVSFELESITRNGQPEPIYNESTESGMRVLELGTDEYVHGTQEYEITYTLRDVVRDFGDYQEFFWDVNGTGWRQPFHELTARVHLEDVAAEGFTGGIRCFEGPVGATNECPAQVNGQRVTFQAADRLEAGENVSLVLEFESGTFEPFDEGWMGWVRTGVATGVLLLGLATVLLAAWLRWRCRDGRNRGVIIPQYTPPGDLSVVMAAHVYSRSKPLKKSVVAQLVDLAVRGQVVIIERERYWLGVFPGKKYEIELKDNQDMSDTEKQVVAALFGNSDAVGERHEIGSENTRVGRRMQSLQKQVKKAVIEQGYRHKINRTLWAYVPAAMGMAVGFGLVWEMSAAGFEDWRVAAPFTAFGAIVLAGFLIGEGLRPLTDTGREIVDYLEGLRDYIQLAEAERLRVLQSPEGAQTSAIDADDARQIVRLYEQLLPYAVLFGQEKQWSRQLGEYYERIDSAPSWYAGASGFNAGNFSSSLSSFSSSSSSSSSGMSSGGASGGGGGGGGGGGR